MILAKMTPMIGRGAPAARANTTPQSKMSRDWVSWRGLKRAIYEECVMILRGFLGKSWDGFSMARQVLGRPFSSGSEGIIERGGTCQQEIRNKKAARDEGTGAQESG